MDTIGTQDLWTFHDNGENAEVATCQDVRQCRGHAVKDYMDLAAKIAELQFRNRDYVLLFRGQDIDHKDHGIKSSLLPSLFRTQNRWFDAERRQHDPFGIMLKFEKLKNAEVILSREFAESDFIGNDEISRHRILRWSILQHYEVCDTPLLDVTHSLRIGASFASIENNSDEAFLYALGIPNISGAISASAEAGLQIVRLSSVCPPVAMRPHLQEGYLLGIYPEIDSHEQKQIYGLSEIDFGKRLIAKFRFNPNTFWTKSGQFQMIGKHALYPSERRDPLYALANRVKRLAKFNRPENSRRPAG